MKSIDFSEKQLSARSDDQRQPDWYDERIALDNDKTLNPDDSILNKRQTVAGKKSPLLSTQIDPGFSAKLSINLKMSQDSASMKNYTYARQDG